MNYAEFLINEILSSKRNQSHEFQGDNLDYLTFDLYEDGDNYLSNEHGTELQLTDLSIVELETLNLLMGNKSNFVGGYFIEQVEEGVFQSVFPENESENSQLHTSRSDAFKHIMERFNDKHNVLSTIEVRFINK